MEMTYPVAGETFKSNSLFGMRGSGKHKGIDLKADSGDRIVAALPGIVVKSDDTSDPNGYGGQILIKHNIDGKIFYTRYAHLKKRYVQTNENVTQGEKIGEAGGGDKDPNKGRATGPHLHFELLDYGQKPINPEPYLKGTLIGGAAALAASSLSGGENSGKTSNNVDTSSDSAGKAVDKLMANFMKVSSPISYLTSLKGLSEPQKESKIPKPILEDIERIKQLLK
jgi:Peptidase family M23